MIRINLNRSRVDTGTEGVRTTVHTEAIDPLNMRNGVVKVFVMCLGVAGLMLYEHQNLDDLNAKMSVISTQLRQLKADVSQKQAEMAKLKDIEPQAQALNEKLKLLREFSKLRLEQLQSLDFIQSVIPEKVWLRSLTYDNKRYQIFGNSVETADLTDFVSKLETSAYFQDVIVIQDKDKAVAHGAKIRDFEITARSGGGKVEHQ